MASKFEVFNGNADNEEMLRIGTSSHYIGFESLVNDIVEFSSLRENGGLRNGLWQRLFWLLSVWVEAHTDFVNQLPTSSVLSWDQEKEVSGVPGNSWVRRNTEQKREQWRQ